MKSESSITIILIVFGCASLLLLVLTALCCFTQSRSRVSNGILCCFRNSKIHPPTGEPSSYLKRGEYYMQNVLSSDSESSSDEEDLYNHEHSKFLSKKRQKIRLKYWPNLLHRSYLNEKGRSFPEIDMKKLRRKSIIGKGNYGYDLEPSSCSIAFIPVTNNVLLLQRSIFSPL